MLDVQGCSGSGLPLPFYSLPLSAFHRVHSHSHCTHCSLFRRRGPRPRNDAALGLEGQGWRWAAGKKVKEVKAKEEEVEKPTSAKLSETHPLAHSQSLTHCQSARPSNFLSKQRQVQNFTDTKAHKHWGSVSVALQWTRPPCRNRPLGE